MAQSTFEQTRPLILSELDSLFLRLGIKKKDIESAIMDYDSRVQIIVNRGLQIEPSHCLFDWAVAAAKGDQHAISFIKFIKTQLNKPLWYQFESEHMKEIHRKIRF